MEWDKGYSARYYASILDKATRKEVDRIELLSGAIKRTTTDLRESADLKCLNYNLNQEQYIRVWLDAKQNGSSSHTPLFTGIATSSGKDYHGGRADCNLECYSMLKIAQDVLLPRGWYAPLETDGAVLIKDLLKVTGVNVILPEDSDESSRRLKQAIISENGENHLSMADAILTAMGWRMVLDGYGDAHIGPYPKSGEIKMTMSPLENDIIENDISVDYDWFDCPNIFRAVSDNLSAVAVDDSESSPFSTVNRGREVWAEETSCDLNTDETISDYAKRRLFELQQVATEISYDRRYIPELYPTDHIVLNYPQQKISGEYYITHQSITLGPNAKTSEEVMKYEQ